MRFAIDACVPEQLAEALRRLGADVISAAGRPAMPDEEILRGTVVHDRVLITSDKDFGELVFHRKQAALGIVLMRFDLSSFELTERTAARIAALASAGRGAFTVLDVSSDRIRPMHT